MRRWPLALVILLPPAAAADTVGPPTPAAVRITEAQQAMALYKSEFGPVPLPAPCQRPKDNETVVCGVGGRGGSPERLPLPDERGPADQPRMAVGEVRPDIAAPPPGVGTCATDRQMQCGAGINVIAAAVKGVQLVRALVDPEGASDAADASAPHHP